MNNALPELLLQLLADISPLIPVPGVSTAVNFLTQIVPIVMSEATYLVPRVKDIIGALKSTTGVSDADMAALAVLDAQIDAGFDAATTDIPG